MPFSAPTYESLSDALRGSPVTVFFQDMDGRFIWFENTQTIWARRDLIGSLDADVFTDLSVQKIRAARQACLDTQTPKTVEVQSKASIAPDGRPRILKITIKCATDQRAGLCGYLSSCVDVTLERQREETMRTLIREVAHRSKNMLAMVLSLSAQTARHARSVDGFIRSFTGRVQSMAKSQNVVTDSNWTGAYFQDLVDQQVTSVVPQGTAQIEVVGENPRFSPTASIHLGLALHELVTNALVHGVLSAHSGKIEISCTLEAAADESQQMKVCWNEMPRIAHGESELAGTGFGRKLLERVVPTAVGGHATFVIDGERVEYCLYIGADDFTL